MMRWATTVALMVVLAALAMPRAVRADDSQAAPAPQPAADGQQDSGQQPAADKKLDGEARGDQKSGESAAASEDKKADEFHVDLGDIKDLRDADIVLPKIDDIKPSGTEEPKAAPSGPALPRPKPAADTAPQPEAAPDAKGGEARAERPPLENPQEIVDRIIENMDQSAGLLGRKKDPGEKTQAVQKKILEDLSALIEYEKQRQAQSNQNQQNQQNQQAQRDSQRQQRSQNQPNNSQQQRQGQRPQPRRRTQPMQSEQATHGTLREAEVQEVAKMLEERWGDLLPNSAKETLQGIQEMILPKYRDLLSRYFYALARQSAESVSGAGGDTGGGEGGGR